MRFRIYITNSPCCNPVGTAICQIPRENELLPILEIAAWGFGGGNPPGDRSLCSRALTGHPSLWFLVARSVLKPNTLPDIQVTDAEATPNAEAPGSGAGEPGSDLVGFGQVVGSSCLGLQFI